jgi:hypothetical protein
MFLPALQRLIMFQDLQQTKQAATGQMRKKEES